MIDFDIESWRSLECFSLTKKQIMFVFSIWRIISPKKSPGEITRGTQPYPTDDVIACYDVNLSCNDTKNH
jgi:hypothetical protein